MIRFFRSIASAAFAMAVLSPLPGCVVREAEGPGVPGNVDDFRDELAPYGQWIETREGLVWKPTDATADFTPYATNGHWEYTDVGWVFESEVPYGHLVYHYGRWYQDPGYGWVWAPDTVWGPSWVDWRFGPSYIGWYPIAPSGVMIGGSGWIFVHSSDFVRPYAPARVVGSVEVATAYRSTEAVPAFVSRSGARVSVGPAPERVEAATGTHIRRKSYHGYHAATPHRSSMGHTRAPHR